MAKLAQTAGELGGAQVAVAVCRVPSDYRNTHSGICHAVDGGRLLLLHLPGPSGRLKSEPFDWQYLLAVPDLLEEEADRIRGLCRAVDRAKPRIPYSFRFDPEATLDQQTGTLVSDHAPHGLTCATFVLAVFNSVSVRLVDTSAWPHRPEDEAWYSCLTAIFNGRIPDAQLTVLRRDVACARVRPEEVAGACLEESRPVAFARCAERGLEVLGVLDGTATASPPIAHLLPTSQPAHPAR